MKRKTIYSYKYKFNFLGMGSNLASVVELKCQSLKCGYINMVTLKQNAYYIFD